jgi:hypothetical protein
LVLGMSLATFTLVHVILSLIGIAAGLVVLFGMLAAKRLEGWTALFLITTILTSVTGFFFPVAGFMPSHAVGIVSLVFLAAALVARYAGALAGAWRLTYVVSATVALYLNVFVLVVQGFQKVAFLEALAPTQSEPPFLIAQFAVLAIFIGLGVLAARGFHPREHALARA